jgi:hypothetical protein
MNQKTKEQQELYDSFLPNKYKKKRYKKKETVLIELPKTMSRTEYMNNCIFWLNEYYTKRCTKEHALKAAESLKRYCEEIMFELKNNNQ